MLGHEGAGIVREVGAGVTRCKKGDKVYVATGDYVGRNTDGAPQDPKLGLLPHLPALQERSSDAVFDLVCLTVVVAADFSIAH